MHHPARAIALFIAAVVAALLVLHVPAASAAGTGQARPEPSAGALLKGQPSNAKQHYTQAEQAARQGHFDVAREQLAIAERLSPGLPFVKPAQLDALRRQIFDNTMADAGAFTRQMGAGPATLAASGPEPAFNVPWGALAVLVAIAVVVIALLRGRSAARRAARKRGEPPD